MKAERILEIDESKKELARKVFKNVPFVQMIGLELIDLNPGEAVLQLKMRDELRQPHGVMHGGAIASLIDTATAFAQITVLEEGENAVTVDLNMHFLRPVAKGTITCTAKIVKAGKRLSTISAEVFNEEGKIISTALSTYTKI